MRTVVILLCFAAAFGLAGLWQSQRLKRLEQARELVFREQEGELGRTPSGWLEAGAGVVVIGRASGADPIARPPSSAHDDAHAAQPTGATTGQATTQPVAPPSQLSDFELAVQPGQNLSSIVREYYGSAAPELIHAFARYNGIANENVLDVGRKLKLPSAQTLGR